MLYNKDQTTLIQCPGSRTGNFTIPTGVASIGTGAFAWDRYLSSVTIPNGVTNIGLLAFAYCYAMTNVTIPSSVVSIGDQAFNDCVQLTSATIPPGIIHFGYGTFEYCANLTSVYFLGSTPPSLAGNVFLTDTNATVYFLPGVTNFGASYAGLPTAAWTNAPYAILTVIAAPANGGTVTGSGTYLVGTNVQMTATEKPGWQFTGWNDTNASPSRVINVHTGGATYTGSFAIELPTISTAPAITNSLLQVNHIAVIVPGQVNAFQVAPGDPADPNLWYFWNFGDGSTSGWSAVAVTTHSYATNNCGVYATASVTISNLLSAHTVSSNFTVSAACTLALTKLQLGLSFIRTNTDTCQLAGKLSLPGLSNVVQLASTVVVVDVGDAQVPFTLDNKGRGVTKLGTCRLVYTKPTRTKSGYWTATIALSKGNWRSQWANYGLDNATHKSPGLSVQVPVAILVGNESFAADPHLHYIATVHKTGVAK